MRMQFLEQNDDEQNDQDQKEKTTTDIHLQPSFRLRADRNRYPLEA
jgi:hypothetical protein